MTGADALHLSPSNEPVDNAPVGRRYGSPNDLVDNAMRQRMDALGEQDSTWNPRRNPELYWQMVATIADSIIILPVLGMVGYAGGGFNARNIVAFFLSVIRHRLAWNMLSAMDRRMSDDDMSMEAADKEWFYLLRWQRWDIWCICFLSMIIVGIYSMGWSEPFRPASTVFWDDMNTTAKDDVWVIPFIVYFILFTCNFCIGMYNCMIACRARASRYAFIMPPRSRFMRPREIRLIKYEDLVHKLQAAAASSGNQCRTDQSSCIICLSDFEGADQLAELPCGHFFHDSCVHIWFARQPLCPYRCEESARDIQIYATRMANRQEGVIIEDNTATILQTTEESAHGGDQQLDGGGSLQVDVAEQQGIIESYETAAAESRECIATETSLAITAVNVPEVELLELHDI